MAMRGHGSENGWGIKCRCSSGSSNNTHKEEEESREFVEANREDHWGEDTLFRHKQSQTKARPRPGSLEANREDHWGARAPFLTQAYLDKAKLD